MITICVYRNVGTVGVWRSLFSGMSDAIFAVSIAMTNLNHNY